VNQLYLSLALACVILPTALAGAPAAAQDDNTITTHKQTFQIPFAINPAVQSTIKEVRLYVSTDAGKNWKKVATVAPDVKTIPFTAPQDGVYWFSAITVSKDGTASPASPKKLKPLIKVQVKDSKEAGM
jgi:hypothetical protein